MLRRKIFSSALTFILQRMIMILASKSPRRIQLMNEAGFDVEVMPADIDETPLPNEAPLELVERLAYLKARAIQDKVGVSDKLILAADSIVWIDNTILGKPKDKQDAFNMLKSLSNTTHHVSSGVCLIYKDKVDTFTDTTDVVFYDLTDDMINAYIESGEPFDKAGAYGIQGKGRALVKCINGNYFNVVGLPIAQTLRRIDTLCDSNHLLESLRRKDD